VERVTRGAHKKRAVLLISDGQDNNSHYTFDELRDLLTESDVSVYSICVAEKGNDEPTLKGEKTLRDISAVTGGRFFQPGSAEEMYEVFERIALELRTQYSIGYYPTTPVTKGGYRKTKVRTTRKGAVVRARPGYTAVKDFRR
jgi:Ca-activated chloride channel family protein